MEKLIFSVSVTQKEQLSGVFIFEFNFDTNLRHPIETFANTSLEFGSSLPCKKLNSFIKSSASIVSEADAIDLIAALYCTLYLVVNVSLKKDWIWKLQS